MLYATKYQARARRLVEILAYRARKWINFLHTFSFVTAAVVWADASACRRSIGCEHSLIYNTHLIAPITNRKANPLQPHQILDPTPSFQAPFSTVPALRIAADSASISPPVSPSKSSTLLYFSLCPSTATSRFALIYGFVFEQSRLGKASGNNQHIGPSR